MHNAHTCIMAITRTLMDTSKAAVEGYQRVVFLPDLLKKRLSPTAVHTLAGETDSSIHLVFSLT